MKWDIFLLFFSLSMVFIWAGVGIIVPLTQAEAIADQLAPRIGVDRELLRMNLQDILRSGELRQTVVLSTPWIILSLLLLARLLADVVKKQRNQTCSGADGK